MTEPQPIPEQPSPATTPPGTSRLAFNDEIVGRSSQFARDLMQLVPEVEAVAIVPSFTLPQEHFPFGIVMGRNGALRSPAEIMHMAVQLHGCLRHHLDAAFQTLRNIDEYMGERQELLRQLEDQIRVKQQELNQLAASAGQHKPPGPPAGAGAVT